MSVNDVQSMNIISVLQGTFRMEEFSDTVVILIIHADFKKQDMAAQMQY